MDKGPIFIGGLDRTGKTPLRRMLGVHPDLVITRHTCMWPNFYQRFGDLSNPQNLNRILDAMRHDKAIQALEPDLQRIKKEFLSGTPSYGRLFALFHQHNAERLGKHRWGDQLGMVEQYADPIFEAYPNARMIHMVRDPRDRFEVAQNGGRHRWGKVGWSMAAWIYSMHLATQNCHQYPGRYLVVRYEELEQDTEGVLRSICAFLEEDYLPEMVTIGNLDSRSKDGNHSGSQHRHRYRSMSKRELLFIQHVTRKQRAEYGYSAIPVQLSPLNRTLYYFFDLPINQLNMLAWNQIEGRKPSVR